MSYILTISLLLLIVITLVLFRNLVSFNHPEEFDPASPQTQSVAICVPARNEERVIERCVNSLINQDYADFKVYVLDDNSTDATGEILSSLEKKNPEKLLFMQGSPKPADWLGKPWACQQLSKNIQADYIIFADADTWAAPDAISRTVAEFNRKELDCITIWPQQELKTFWEKMLIPVVYYTLVAFLPSVYVRRSPRWLPKSFGSRVSPLFAAACGQFIAFRREVYESIGGHGPVKKEVVEDVALARLIKKKGFVMNMYHGLDTVYCRMYENEKALREGFRKNFLAGFGYNVPLFLMVGFLHLLLYILPFITLIWAYLQELDLLSGLSAISVSLILLHRLILALWFRWDAIYVLLHPFSVLWFQFLGFIVLRDYFTGNTATWKGRKVF
ncbi:MAG: glycosyltransferase [Balneolales bacterium]